MKQAIKNHLLKLRKYAHYLVLLSLPVIMSFTLGECQGLGILFINKCDIYGFYSYNDYEHPYYVNGFGEIWVVDFWDCSSRTREYDAPGDLPLNALSVENFSRAIAVGYDGMIVKKEYLGNWELIGSPTNETLRDVCHSMGDIYYVVGNNGTVLKSTDEGNSWFQLPAFTSEDLYDLVCTGNNTISVFGSNVTAFKSTDSGNTWNEMNLYGESTNNVQKGGPDIYTSFYLNIDTGYVFGEFGTIFYTSDGGNQWTPGIVPNFERINTAYFISPDSGMVAGDHGKVRFTVNGGATWVEDTSVTKLTSQNINHISIIDNSVAVIVGDSGTIIFAAQDSSALTSVNNNPAIVNEYKLNQNCPNPFNPSTKISWQSPVGGHHSLKIYDVIGNKIVTLVDEYKPAGSYEVEFDSHSGSIRNLTSGIYFYRLTIGNEFTSVKKMILLK